MSKFSDYFWKAVHIYCIIIKQQIQMLKNFNGLNSQQWSILQQQDMTFLINNITADEFRYQKLNLNSLHLLDIYKARSLFCIPHTPHIILSSYQIDNYSMQMLVQTAPFHIDKLIKRNLCETSIQELIKTIIKTIQFLVKKFGFFRITNDMIKVTRSQNILVWVHENFNSTHTQFPISSSSLYQDYKIMINDVLAIFENAGCKKQLQPLRNKIQHDKLLSFEKFKIVLENNLKCNKNSIQKSTRIMYGSPQFLKKKTSPDTKRAATQKFFQSHKQARFATSFNIAAFDLKNSNSSKREVSQNTDSGIFYYSKAALLQSDSSRRSLYFNSSQDNYSGNQMTQQQKQTVLTLQKNSQKQSNLNNSTDMKKKNFRDSGNSIATTTAFMNSVDSSGKLKIMSFDEHNFPTNNLVSTESRGLVSSLGVKQSKNFKQLKQNFKVKASKIIEEKNEELIVQSFIKGQKSVQSARQSEVQNEFDVLLKSETSSQYRPSSDLLELESEIQNILFN